MTLSVTQFGAHSARGAGVRWRASHAAAAAAARRHSRFRKGRSVHCGQTRARGRPVVAAARTPAESDAAAAQLVRRIAAEAQRRRSTSREPYEGSYAAVSREWSVEILIRGETQTVQPPLRAVMLSLANVLITSGRCQPSRLPDR